MLKVDAIGKRYGSKMALDNVSFELAHGETFGLIGLNGAGKTTMIKCLLDMQRADHGMIHIGDKKSTEPQARRQLAYLPEKFSPPDYMSGVLFLHYINDTQRDTQLDVKALQKAAEQLCEQLELPAEVLQQSVKTYSKGMLQKLGLVGCMLSDKKLLVLDEPMSGLDPRARVSFREAIHRLRSQGKTLLFCTHILNDVESLCERVGILHAGRLLFVGAPDECRSTYGAGDLEQAFLNCLQQHHAA